MGNLQCGSKLAQPCLSDTDPRYSSTASDNLVDQSQTWEDIAGFWAPINYDYLTNVTDTPSTRPPTLFNLTSNQGWPYTRDRFTGINRRILDGSRFVEQAILFYPPAPEELCNREVPEGMANVVGVDPNDPSKTNAKCGVNGNVFYQEVWYTSTYERNGRADVQWVTSGPVYSRSPGSPPRPGESYREPIGDEASFQYVSYDIPGFPFTFGGTETFVSADKKYAFGTGNSAIGLPVEECGGTGITRNTYLYSVNKVDGEMTFLEEVRKAYAANNIVEDEIPTWVTNGEPMPSCLISKSGGTCPIEEYLCGVNGTDPGCTSSPYEEPTPAMKPGAVAGFIILGLAVVVAIGYAVHRYIVKKKQKKLRTLFAQQVTKRVDLRRSVSQLNPDSLAAEFTRIDQGLKNNKDGTADGFISKDELWDFVQSGKAGQMTKKDFDALFDAMDIKNRGKVNFVEFAAFMAECAGEIREAAAVVDNNNFNEMNPKNDKSSSKATILRAASVRISSMEFTTPDKPSKDESESPV